MGSSWGDAARDLDPRRLAASAIPAGSQWKRAKESYWVRGRVAGAQVRVPCAYGGWVDRDR
jgi:hypothetical protein